MQPKGIPSTPEAKNILIKIKIKIINLISIKNLLGPNHHIGSQSFGSFYHSKKSPNWLPRLATPKSQNKLQVPKL